MSLAGADGGWARLNPAGLRLTSHLLVPGGRSPGSLGSKGPFIPGPGSWADPASLGYL